jgi:DNA-binding beta-propeller fold protein YncE
MIMSRRLSAALCCVSLLLMVSGCAQLPAEFDAHPSEAANENQVWPAPPEQARFRYVGQLTGEANFPHPGEEELNLGTRFLRWVVGLVGHSKQPVILQRPQAVATDDQGRIFVSDVSRQAVYVFDTREAKLEVWQYAAKGIRFEVPVGLAPTGDGGVLVTDAALHLVARLGPDGKPQGYFGLDELKHPTGLARDPVSKRIYVADRGSNEIKVYNAAGKLQFKFGGFGEKEGLLNGPTYLFWRDNRLYVTDTLNSRIQVFSPEGKFLSKFGHRGLVLGDLPRPKGVAVSQDGMIYVVESFYDYLLIFNRKGELLLPIGGTGQEVGQFYLPAGVWVDKDLVYVADTFNGRVMIFKYLGEGDASDVAGGSGSDGVGAAKR